MIFLKQRVNLILLLSAFLWSCLQDSQTAESTAVAPVPTPTSGQAIFYLDGSALSYGVFETEAISVAMDVSNTLPKRFSDSADVTVDDGFKVTTYTVWPGESKLVHHMPVGKKRVTITGGGQVKSSNEITGVFINKITFGGPAVAVKPDSRRIVIYGDSIAVGGNVDSPSAEAWPVLLRQHYSVLVHAYAYRALHDDASTSAARTELASSILSSMPEDVWLAIGTNDYGLEPWSAREFGEAYAATLDAIHSSNPQARVFAQSPILQVNEPTNSFGNNLDDYRQQIADACLVRSTWCLFIDGRNPAFPQPDELDKDGIHLTLESSMKYAQAVLNIIGK